MERNNKKYDDITSGVVNALQNEHNEMFLRTRSFDTRASILISILLAILPFYFEILDWKKISVCLNSSCISFKDVCMLIFLFLSLLTLLVSLVLNILVILSRKYHTFPSDNYLGFNIIEYENIDTTVNDMNTAIIGSYAECIRLNTPIINRKAKYFISAIFTTGFFILFVIISTLCNLL